MSLAKQILANRENEEKVACDEFGIPIKDENDKDVQMRPQYLVARTFLLQGMDPRYEHGTTRCLHMREDALYNHNREVKQDTATFYRLTGVTYQVNQAIQTQFWEELKRRVPRLNTTIYKICDNLWWDKKTGEMVVGDYDTIKERIKER